MAEVLGKVVSTVVTAASTHQQSGDFKPEQQQSAIDMQGSHSPPVEPPDVRVLISYVQCMVFLHWFELGHS